MTNLSARDIHDDGPDNERFANSTLIEALEIGAQQMIDAQLKAASRQPIVVSLSTFDLRMTTGTDDADTWAQMKALLIERGVPAERLEGKPDFRSEETEYGLTLEFP